MVNLVLVSFLEVYIGLIFVQVRTGPYFGFEKEADFSCTLDDDSDADIGHVGRHCHSLHN